jgi:protein CpxP
MIRKTLIVALLVFFVGGVLFVSGCRHPGRGHHAAFMVDYVSETLDLNDEQQAKLNEIKDEFVDKRLQMRADHRAMHDAFMVELQKDQIDPLALQDILAEHRAHMDEMMSLAISRFAEFHQMLTPEQKEKLVSKIEQFHSWHGKGWQ